jgi:LPS-assembly protein
LYSIARNGRRAASLCAALAAALCVGPARAAVEDTAGPVPAVGDHPALLVPQPRRTAADAALAIGRCREGGEAVRQPANGEVLFQAETLSYDAKSQTVTADGKVEASFWGCVLVADHVEYQVGRNLVRASGDVAIVEPSGNVVFAKSLELANGLEEGIVSSFSAVLASNTRIAANSAERRPGGTTRLKHVVYSPCRICKTPGFEPLWQIKAVRVTHDEAHKTIRYQSAMLEVKGVPVFYLPYFEHADPSVKRKTGFLVPSVGSSTDLGSYAEIPYFLQLAPNSDLTISPLITTDAANVLKGEYRLRRRSGQFRLSGSFAKDQVESSTIPGLTEENWRSHFFGDGRFRLSDVWSYGFNAQLTSDDTYLKRYQIYDYDRLRSQLFAEGFAGRDFASLETFYFQGLRADDDPGKTPLVLPLGKIVWYPNQRVLNGRLKLEGSILGIARSQGSDSGRLSLSGEWRRESIGGAGHMFSTFAALRTDLYYTHDVNPTHNPVLPDDKGFIERFIPTIGTEWHWPLTRSAGAYYHVIEPIAQIVFSPYGGRVNDVPNEDSASFEFDDTNLFSANKLPGYDLVESGPRANVGLRYGLYGPRGSAIDFLIGENLRLKEQTVFDRSTGLGDQQSDFVGRLRVSPARYFDFIHRFRIDREDLSFNRNEFTGQVGTKDYWARVSYVQLSEGLTASGLEPREEFAGSTRLKLWENWYFEAAARRDLVRNKMISSGGGLVFSNECAEVAFQYKRRFTRDREIRPSSSFTVRIRLKTFGETSNP